MAAAVFVIAGTVASVAQNVSNEAWLGQVGSLNVLDITQQGRGNSAGADNVWLLLGQDGVGNDLILDQYGYNNKLGTLFADEDAYARGIWQCGDLNSISVTQRNSQPDGANVVGSIQQSSAYTLPPDSDAFNSLYIVQTAEGDASGVGGHYVGRVVQSHTGPAAAARNNVFIVQRGGGLGEGNVLANLRQIGSGNSLGSIQTGAGNRIGEVPPPDGSLPVGGIVQEGSGNRAWLVQSGLENLIEYVQQYGARNAARVSLSGDRNVVSQIFQNSESWGELATGNRITVVISGEDNGGSGAGWVGELIQLPALGTPGIAQAAFVQIGDGNGIDLAILAGIENKYGVTQIGDGNNAHVSMAGASIGADAFRNETAILQSGEVNYVSHIVTGNDNAGAVRMEGDRNRLALSQYGAFNVTRVTIEGNDNNNTSSALFGVALDLTGSIADVTLQRGAIVQVGIGLSEPEANRIGFDVAGNANALAFYQRGQSNLLQGSVSGSNNALAVVQTGARNTTLTSQDGFANSLAVHQF